MSGEPRSCWPRPSVTEHGAIAPRRFYESPYTDLDDQGIHGVFPEADVHQIIAIVQRIGASAQVA